MSREHVFPNYRHVTDIIDIFQKFSIPKKKLEELAERGTKVHKAITAHLNDKFYMVDDETATYFDAYLKFKQENKFSLFGTEKRFFCDKLMITGEVDALMLFEGFERPMIVDFKTSRLENAPIWILQGAFYYYLLRTNGIEVEKKYRFIQLGGNYGMYFIREYEFNEGLLDVCHAALTAHKYFVPTI